MSNSEESSTRSASRPTRLGCVLGLLAIPLFFFLLMAGVGTGLVDLGVTVLFGWIKFAADTWPRISWNWSAIWTGILCVGVVLLLGHWFLNGLCRSIASAQGKTFSWPWKWTWCGLTGVGLCFLVGMAVAGAAHQIGWIAESEETLFEDKYRVLHERSRVRHVCYVIAGCLNATNTVESLRTDIVAEFERETEGRHSSQWPDLQSLHLLLLTGSDAKVEGVLVFPRDAEARLRFGGEYQGQADRQTMRFDELMKFIRTNEARLVAF